jgi:hypothetical protein
MSSSVSFPPRLGGSSPSLSATKRLKRKVADARRRKEEPEVFICLADDASGL